jgi:N-acetylglutamate synthase-like GNAT family acetyltransferase
MRPGKATPSKATPSKATPSKATPSTSSLPTLRPATAADVPAVERLLGAAELPRAGVADAIATFVLAEHGVEVVGVAGLELCGDNGLLRSVAVTPAWQNRGLARRLVRHVIAAARERHLRVVYLLTTTAADYFATLGFARTTRQTVPQDVAATEEFASLCPASAVVMMREVEGSPAAPDRD